MPTIRAIYENGVFRPTSPVDLPEHSIVEFEPRPIRDEMQPQLPPSEGVFAVLSERYASGETDVAARHNEHGLDDTPARIEPMDPGETLPADDPIYRITDLAVPTGIPDLARNIDHYLYGHPKVT